MKSTKVALTLLSLLSSSMTVTAATLPLKERDLVSLHKDNTASAESVTIEARAPQDDDDDDEATVYLWSVNANGDIQNGEEPSE